MQTSICLSLIAVRTSANFNLRPSFLRQSLPRRQHFDSAQCDSGGALNDRSRSSNERSRLQSNNGVTLAFIQQNRSMVENVCSQVNKYLLLIVSKLY